MIHKTDWTNDVSIVDGANLNRIENNIETLEEYCNLLNTQNNQLSQALVDTKTELDKQSYRPILWEGAWYVSGTQTITYKDKLTGEPVNVNDLPNGIILYFSNYGNGAVLRSFNHCQVISKHTILENPGYATAVSNVYSTKSEIWMKYLYISPDKLTGNDINQQAPNNKIVLVKIVGF